MEEKNFDSVAIEKDREPYKKGRTSYQCPHPLLLSIVLRSVFDFLELEDLQSARAVCKLWNEVSQDEIKNRGTIVIEGEEKILPTLEILKKLKKKTSEFVIKGCNLDGKNLQTLINKLLPALSFLRLQNCFVNSVENFHKLLRKVLPEIRKLDLSIVKYFDESGDPRYVKFFPLPDQDDEKSHLVFENLKFLKIICVHIYEEDRIFLSSICKTFPNLKELVIESFPPEDPENLKDCKMPFLRSLNIQMIPHVDTENGDHGLNDIMRDIVKDGGLKDVHIKMLINMELKLQEFDLRNVNRNTDSNLFKTFLQSQSDCLKILKLGQGTIKNQQCTLPAPCPFPLVLAKLQNLHVDRVFVKNLNHVFNSCENVDNVNLNFYEEVDWRPILTARIPPRPNLNSLVVYNIPLDVLSKLTPLWENVSNLHLLNCTDEMLTTVFEKAMKLKVLSLRESRTKPLSATAFTGLNEEDMSSLATRETAGVKTSFDCVKSLRGNRQFLGSLKGLQNMVLGLHGTSMLKPLAKFALKYCAKLQTVAVYNPDEGPMVDPKSFKDFVSDDIKLFIEKEAGYISARVATKGVPATQFSRADHLPFYRSDEMKDILRGINRLEIEHFLESNLTM